MAMNKIFITGNITREPEIKTVNGDKSVCHFTVAVNDGFGENQQTYFFNVVSWNGQAEYVARWAKKGNKVAVVGKLTQRTYENKDKEKVTVVEIISQEVEVLTYDKGDNKEEKERPKLEEIDDGDLPF